MSQSNERLPPWTLPILASLLGAATYALLWLLPVRIEQTSNLAPAMTSLATLYGTVAGFLITAVIFIAGASGKSMTRIRRAATEKGIDLVIVFSLSIVLAFAAAVGLSICSVFSNGWGAVLAAIVLAWLPLPNCLLTGLALMTALRGNQS